MKSTFKVSRTISTLAVLMATSVSSANVAITLDPIQIKKIRSAQKAPENSIAVYSDLTEYKFVRSTRNPYLASLSARAALENAHQINSMYEACRNYQVEQAGIALSQHGSPLKAYLKDYSKVYGGKVSLLSLVKIDFRGNGLLLEPRTSPSIDITEVADNGLSVILSPVVEANIANPGHTAYSCNIMSAAEISELAQVKVTALKAMKLKKSRHEDAFSWKDFGNTVSSVLQTPIRGGYNSDLEVKMAQSSSEREEKPDASPEAPTASQTLVGSAGSPK